MITKLTIKEIKEIQESIYREVRNAPPTIGLVGVSGVGKSSTINRMFKTKLPTSDTIACTKEFRDTDLELKFEQGEIKNLNVKLRVVDAPGLGEDIEKDPAYILMYKKYLLYCDVILWVTAARNRAIALDQKYLNSFKEFQEKIVFGINQVDLIEPLDWNIKINLPSNKMMKNISEIEDDRKQKISKSLGRRIDIVSYSAKMGFNLEKLFTLLLKSLPEKRRWLYDGLKNFEYTDFIPSDVRRELGLK